jgi:esterase/lipase superfamily enzyme
MIDKMSPYLGCDRRAKTTRKNVVVIGLSLGDWLDVEALEAVRVRANRGKVRKSLLGKAI